MSSNTPIPDRSPSSSQNPANGTRIETLKKHFRDNPDVFAKFNSDPKSATPFNVPKDAAEQFLRSGAN